MQLVRLPYNTSLFSSSPYSTREVASSSLPRALTWPPNHTTLTIVGVVPCRKYPRKIISGKESEHITLNIIDLIFMISCIWRELLAINCRLNTTHSSRNIRVDCSTGIDCLKDVVAKHYWHEMKCNFRWWKHQQNAFGARNRDDKFRTVRNMIN